MSLSVEERMKVAEAWKSFGKMETIMNHIGANSIADVKALAAHSEKIGLDAIALLAPFYYKCNDLDSLMDYLKEVHINHRLIEFRHFRSLLLLRTRLWYIITSQAKLV